MNNPELGKIITGECGRDAIHVAVIPMIATREMKPGEHTKNGLVDPYLMWPVKPGEPV